MLFSYFSKFCKPQQEEEAAAKESFYKADEEEMNYVRNKNFIPIKN